MCHPYMDNATRNTYDGTIISNLIPTFDKHTTSLAFTHACPHPQPNTHANTNTRTYTHNNDALFSAINYTDQHNFQVCSAWNWIPDLQQNHLINEWRRICNMKMNCTDITTVITHNTTEIYVSVNTPFHSIILKNFIIQLWR